MTDLNLSVGQAGTLAAVLLAGGLGAAALARARQRRTGRAGPAVRRLGAVAPFAVEAAVIAALYALWQYLAGFGHSRLGVAVARGRAVYRTERRLHLPSELAVQRAVLPHGWLVQGADLYYAVAHFTAVGLLLLWLFVRHRDRYPAARTVLAVVTAACLFVQTVAVAPPRLLPGAGFVDTAARYGQSVYAPLTAADVPTLLGVDLGADQLSAMPSVHVAWSVLVAVAVQGASRSRWRALVWLHPLVTVAVVVVTANHYWLDGVVALALLGSAAGAVTAGRRVVRRAGRRFARPTTRARPGRDVDAGPARHPGARDGSATGTPSPVPSPRP